MTTAEFQQPGGRQRAYKHPKREDSIEKSVDATILRFGDCCAELSLHEKREEIVEEDEREGENVPAGACQKSKEPDFAASIHGQVRVGLAYHLLKF